VTPAAAVYRLTGAVRDQARAFGELSAQAERDSHTGHSTGARGMIGAAWADLELALAELERALLEQEPPGTITLIPHRYGAKP
jgi:hypothetical protein